MNDIETGQVLDMIAAHYWQQTRKSDDEKVLQVATWAAVFADIPREPHVNLALAAWFETERWPPQASELRDLALELGGPTPAMIAAAEAWRNRRIESSPELSSIPERVVKSDGDLRVDAVNAWISCEAQSQAISRDMVRMMTNLGHGWESWVRIGNPAHWRPEWTPYLEQLTEQAALDAGPVEPLAVAIARRVS